MTNHESSETHKFVSFKDTMEKLHLNVQDLSKFINPDSGVHNGGIPYFSEIRKEGDAYDSDNPNSSFKIHSDDIKLFITKWLEYKKKTDPIHFSDKKLEDYL